MMLLRIKHAFRVELVHFPGRRLIPRFIKKIEDYELLYFQVAKCGSSRHMLHITWFMRGKSKGQKWRGTGGLRRTLTAKVTGPYGQLQHSPEELPETKYLLALVQS